MARTWFVECDNRIIGYELRGVEGAFEGCPIDEEIVDEELSADIDGNAVGRGSRVGDMHRLPRQRVSAGRPLIRQDDAVVETFFRMRKRRNDGC